LIKIGKIVYLGEENELKNRYLLVAKEIQSAKEEIPKGNICTLNCTLEEMAVYNIYNNPLPLLKR